MEIPLKTSTSDAPRSLYVARQPILDERGRVFGYELLYRHSAGATACVADGDVASASVLTSAILDLGLETLTNGRQAFFNVTRPLLLGKLDTLIPPDGVVIELLRASRSMTR